MYKTILTLSFLIATIMLLNTSTLTSQTEEYKRYKKKSAIVKYDQTGTREGFAILYYDEYGMKEANYEKGEMKMFGITQKIETVNYLDGFMQYNIDKINNTATKTENTMLKSMIENTESADLEEIGMEMLKEMGGEKIGSEDVIGKPCEIWEIKQMGTKIWIWNGITLRTETDMMGMKIVKVATSIQTNVSIPSDKIDVPTDVEFNVIDLENINNMIRQYTPE